MKRWIVSACMIFVISSTAKAEVEVFAGLNNIKFQSRFVQGVEYERVSTDADGVELGIRYQWFNLIGVEAGYTAINSIGYESRYCRDVCIPEPNLLDTDLDAWSAGVSARIPFGLFAIRASTLRYFFDGDETERLFKDDEWVYRLGIDMELSKSLGLEFGYKKGDVIDSGYDARVSYQF